MFTWCHCKCSYLRKLCFGLWCFHSTRGSLMLKAGPHQQYQVSASYIRDDFMYVGVAWADCFGRRVHVVTYYEGWFYVCGCGLSTSLTNWSGRRVHKIEPFMVVCMLLYEGRFYVCGCGLGTSLTDCSGRRVHKIDPYMVVWMLLYKGQFYVLYIRLTLIV